jgi:uncharacterized protein YndB with AHSA1/START domain
MTDIHLETVLPISPQAAYSLFTHPVLLEHWMCNNATVEARIGGTFFYTWAAGWWAVGRFTAVDPHQHLAFTWYPEGAPSVTQADVTFIPEGDNTRITIHHTGYDPAIWTEQARTIHVDGWTSGLNNLTYLVETGLDARFMSRPMMGINFEALTPKIVARLGSPVSIGLVLNGVVENSGAANAGLKTNDILISMDGVALATFPDLIAVIERHKAGDTLPVEFYHGQTKHNTQLTFGQRPMPTVPQTQQTLVEHIRQNIASVISELDATLENATEDEMSLNPADGEWNVKQVLAHCIWGERWSAMNIWSIAGGGDYIGWVGNPAHHIAGILAVHPTGDMLVTELKRSMNELPAMLEALDTATLNNPALFKYLSLGNVETGEHIREHIAQIRAALASARASVPV